MRHVLSDSVLARHGGIDSGELPTLTGAETHNLVRKSVQVLVHYYKLVRTVNIVPCTTVHVPVQKAETCTKPNSVFCTNFASTMATSPSGTSPAVIDPTTLPTIPPVVVATRPPELDTPSQIPPVNIPVSAALKRVDVVRR